MKVLKSLLFSIGIVVSFGASAQTLVPQYSGTWESTLSYRTHVLYGANATATPMVVYQESPTLTATFIDKGVSSSQPTKGTPPNHDGSWRQISTGAI
jgi:hypothetical protein